MVKMDMALLHAALLGILKDIDAFCLENGIRYTISGGTLLGAVRHKGFIPWDEDADIAMPRPDFERFRQLYGNKRYSIVPSEDFLAMHLKVQDRTTLIDEGWVKGRYGVFVDVFPLDGMPEDEKECDLFMKRANKVRRRLMLSQRPMLHLRDSQHDPFFAKLEAKMHSPQWWMETFRELCDSYPYGTSARIGAVCGVYGKKEAFPRMVYEEIGRMDFEDTQLNAITNWDTFLTHFYGDYMTPPPENKRGGTHDISAWQL